MTEAPGRSALGKRVLSAGLLAFGAGALAVGRPIPFLGLEVHRVFVVATLAADHGCTRGL